MRLQGVRQLAVLAVTVTVLVGACMTGTSSPKPGTSTGPSGAAPTASATTSVAATAGIAGCPNYVDVVETGPVAPDPDGTGPVPQAQQRLNHDIEAAIAYGAAHPDEFASVRFENAPRVRIVIGFTDHIDVHCAALRAQFEFPDEFEIIQQPVAANDLERIQQEIVALAGPRMRAVGIGAGTIDITLRADGESIAEQLVAKYGDIVSINVGLQPYPAGRAPAFDCSKLPGLLVMGPPFKATLKLDTPSVRSGEDLKGTATVTNSGDAPVEFESGDPATIFIYRTGTDQVVGAYDGGIGGTGLGKTLAPGESIDASAVGGTASCLSELGFALPPGDYDARAAIDQYEHPANGDTIVRYLLSAPARLTVTP